MVCDVQPIYGCRLYHEAAVVVLKGSQELRSTFETHINVSFPVNLIAARKLLINTTLNYHYNTSLTRPHLIELPEVGAGINVSHPTQSMEILDHRTLEQYLQAKQEAQRSSSWLLFISPGNNFNGPKHLFNG